jgi:hypothetical protein
MAAAYLLGILKSPFPPAPEVATRNQRRVPNLVTRRLHLDRRDITEYAGIPCTTVPCTIVHLAGELDDEDQLARVCHEAGVKFATTPSHVEAVLKRHPNAKGAGTLRRIASGGIKSPCPCSSASSSRSSSNSGSRCPTPTSRSASTASIVAGST